MSDVAKKMSSKYKRKISRQSIYQFLKHNNIEVMKLVISEVDKRAREFEEIKNKKLISNN